MPDSRTSYQESRHEAPLMAQAQTDQEKGFEQPKPLPDDDLPSNICNESQLALVPKECLSGNEKRPLLHVDELGKKYHYALQPMMYSVIFILVVELLERFSFYGIYYTQTLFLIGAYNADWNAGFSSVKASSFVSISTMVAYTTPFVGAFLADSVWGDYKSILFGLLFFYLPGVLLVALTTVPYLLGDEFNESLLTLGVLFLWPMGTGIVKSIVNVFGAKQFHPLLQSSLIESYYVNFYMAINIGALAGIAIVPIVAQQNLTVAYFWPLMLLVIGVIIFVAGTPRYVCSPPRGELFAKKKRVNRDETISLVTIFRVCILIVPFCVGYNQMPTTFIVQGTVMTKAFGFVDVASMNSLDATSVLFFGYLTASHIYPALAKRDIKIPTTYKFAMGSFLGALAILWAIFVEHKIHAAYQTNKSQICVLWQAPSYILIGWGEIFAVSAAYEVAFTASSPDKKVLASATNIFCVGGLPNLLCIMLYHGCSRKSSAAFVSFHILDRH
jgi:POT family proton-dependent oligopeptide transporter